MRIPTDPWSLDHAALTYNIDRWGGDYFSINDKGHIAIWPKGRSGPAIDMVDVLDECTAQGLHTPVLVRFQDILRDRVRKLNEAFAHAIAEFNFSGSYRGVFPIKVNQLREVVEEIQDAGTPYNFGLEAGSKPELYAALAVHNNPASLIICNGYKDREFIRIALLGRKLDKQIIMVVEKLEELRLIIEIGREMNVAPLIGIRVRLQAKGAGKWALSGGENAKFGLSTRELLEAVDLLRAENLLPSFQLLHFHVGSQVPDILTIKKAVREATRFYAKLHKLGVALKYIDCGGGLGVDYDGSRTSGDSSTNYTLEEYTRDVVYNIADICDEEKVPHPDIVTESGRAIVAHHSVLLVETFGTIEKTRQLNVVASDSDHKMVREFVALIEGLNKKNRRETLHDALVLKQEALGRFEFGLLDLESKAKIETYFWHLVERIVALYGTVKSLPQELRDITAQLNDQYLCNFSVFQSLIDHWALGQLFPICPIHRLNERPTHSATLVDITCDSDGKIDKFIDSESVRSTLPLHAADGRPYILGFFLMGAYQDVMGDLHNLFGPVNEAHVFLDEDEPSGFYIEETIPGYSIQQVLTDVQYDTQQLARLMKAQIDAAIKSDRLKPSEGMRLLDFFEKGLARPTYLSLNGPDRPAP
ncbi:MAG: biosynthetic arginine decarboxylase [Verrucomicrobiia bacterium]